MIRIRPLSDLVDQFENVEAELKNDGPVYLTKDGYGAVVVMTVEQYTSLTDEVEAKLDEAERAAAASEVRLTHEEVFGGARALINARKAI